MRIGVLVRPRRVLVAAGLIGIVAAIPLTARRAEASFPGNNGKIAFTREVNGNSWIFSMNPDGTAQQVLTKANDNNPAWSPDGTKIAFDRVDVDDVYGDREIWVMNADGTGQVQLTHNGIEDYQPTWSPDGAQIAYIDHAYSPWGTVEIRNADGSGYARRLRFDSVDHYGDFDPSWSPDGTKIAHGRRLLANVYEIIVTEVTPDSTGSEEQLTFAAGQDMLPSWSPDGTKIAFMSERDGNSDIFVMNANGQLQGNLTNNPAEDVHPSWSPDGTKITFASFRYGNWEIYEMNADGTVQVNATAAADSDQAPDWQPVPSLPRAILNTARPVWEVTPVHEIGQVVLAVAEPVVRMIEPVTPPPSAIVSRLLGDLEATVRRVVSGQVLPPPPKVVGRLPGSGEQRGGLP